MSLWGAGGAAPPVPSGARLIQRLLPPLAVAPPQWETGRQEGAGPRHRLPMSSGLAHRRLCLAALSPAGSSMTASWCSGIGASAFASVLNALSVVRCVSVERKKICFTFFAFHITFYSAEV